MRTLHAALVLDTLDIGAEIAVIYASNIDRSATSRGAGVVVALVLKVAQNVSGVVKTALVDITIVDGAVNVVVTKRVTKRRNLAKSSRVVAKRGRASVRRSANDRHVLAFARSRVALVDSATDAIVAVLLHEDATSRRIARCAEAGIRRSARGVHPIAGIASLSAKVARALVVHSARNGTAAGGYATFESNVFPTIRLNALRIFARISRSAK